MNAHVGFAVLNELLNQKLIQIKDQKFEKSEEIREVLLSTIDIQKELLQRSNNRVEILEKLVKGQEEYIELQEDRYLLGEAI